MISGKTDFHISKDNVFVTYIIDLLISEDQGLKDLAIKILTRIYSEMKILGKNLRKTIIIVNDRDKRLWETIKAKTYQMNTMCQNCEIWYLSQNSDEF